MNKEDYKILREINSLNTKLSQLLKNIENESSRIYKINEMRAQRQSEHADLETQLSKKQTLLDSKDNRLNVLIEMIAKTKSEMDHAVDPKVISAMGVQLENARIESKELEGAAFSLLEEIDALHTAISDAKAFLSGSLETIQEIENEVFNENKETYSEIENIKTRVELAMNQIPEVAKEKIKSLLSENKKVSPLTEISNSNACILCGSIFPIAQVALIEKSLKLHSCPGCSRIVIPQNSKY